MRISFSPQRPVADDALAVSVAGDVLTVNGEAFDLSELPEGATIPDGQVPCASITGSVERVGGEVRLTLILPVGPNPPAAMAFPEPIIVTEDGPVAIPAEEEPADVEA